MDRYNNDELLFGWDPTPGIISIWADRDGRALVWRRIQSQTICEHVRFRPWLFAADLADLDPRLIVLCEDPIHHPARIAVCELDAAETHCGFLIAARSGRALERALLAGASQRLGRSVQNLYELEDRYIRVGPVEQYLMASGRTSFRGMVFDDLRRMQIDFETTALDPKQGRIFMAAIRDTQGLAAVLEAPTEADEPRLIADLCALVRQHDPDVIENHNLFGFDLPFLEERARVHQVELDLGRPEGPPGLTRLYDPPSDDPDAPRRHRYTLAGRELVDTLDAVRRHDFVTRDLPNHRLKDVARHFGIAAPDRVYIAGASIYDRYQSDPDAVRRYALDDVSEVDALSRRLLLPAFALAGMAPRRYERLNNAGPAMGILEPILLRAYLRAGAAPPRPGVAARGATTPHTGGAMHLFGEGIAEHVVKADVASLYPSLMITYAIGPKADQLGALLAIVTRLTELRLAHKRAARDAVPGSLDAAHHNALQAAMKLVINSAYGYLGAGSMALFADRFAADEITRRGREVLDHVVGELRGRGVALIEADTDGVYFAVPPGWDENRERSLVADVAATLPAGIRLEYEGRYQAMFSHEVKNYALLTYDGRLIVRGAALRSSRSEPFGERFLVTALHCLLRGDVMGVRQAYLETVAALRDRLLPADDLATRVRLSKSSAEYMNSRQRQREAAYEALRNAGRTEWARGERVRHYRNRHGAQIWLPDSADNQVSGSSAHDYDIDYYHDTLLTSYVGRLRKAFEPADFETLFRRTEQIGLFDSPVQSIHPRFIRPS